MLLYKRLLTGRTILISWIISHWPEPKKQTLFLFLLWLFDWSQVTAEWETNFWHSQVWVLYHWQSGSCCSREGESILPGVGTTAVVWTNQRPAREEVLAATGGRLRWDDSGSTTEVRGRYSIRYMWGHFGRRAKNNTDTRWFNHLTGISLWF